MGPLWIGVASAALLVCALSSPPRVLAQSGGPEAEPDSGEVLGNARQAQARFERVRFFRLPWTMGGGSRPCDEHVGRFCVWHDRSDDEWDPPPEHRDVSEARDVLLVHLRQALERHPGDSWVVGQRVAYLIEAERTDDAEDAVRACRAESWWCAALDGLVHHERGEILEAERAFQQALDDLPPDERAEWLSLDPVLTRDDERRAADLPQAIRDSVAQQLWWLADPLWMRHGNDRRTEHLARLVRARLANKARNAEGIRWAEDMELLLLRFGHPAGWERYSTGTIERRVNIVTHRTKFGREFVPPLEHAESPSEMPRNAWSLTPRMPTSEYAPRYARFEGRLDAQIATLPDGDSAVIAAVFAFDHDSVSSGDSVVAALVAGTPGDVAVDSAGGVAGRVSRTLRVARRDMVASLEAVTVGAVPRAARVRLGIPLALSDALPIALSDPVLIRGGAEPLTRAAAVDAMLLPSEVGRADSIGVYLEASRLAPDVPIEIELALDPEQSGGLRRLGEALGLVSPKSAVRLAWQERPPAAGRLTRAVTLGFEGVPEGTYMLRLTVRQGSAVGSSEVWVERK